MTRWLQVWAWSEEQERARRLEEAIAYFRLDPSEVVGLPDVEEEVLQRYDEAVSRKS